MKPVDISHLVTPLDIEVRFISACRSDLDGLGTGDVGIILYIGNDEGNARYKEQFKSVLNNMKADKAFHIQTHVIYYYLKAPATAEQRNRILDDVTDNMNGPSLTWAHLPTKGISYEHS